MSSRFGKWLRRLLPSSDGWTPRSIMRVCKALPLRQQTRLLLLYAPRSWGATFLHALMHMVTIVGLLMIFAFGFNDDSGEFRWSEYARLHHSGAMIFLLSGVLFWGFLVFLLWYVTSVKN